MNREHQTRKKIIKNLPHFWMYAIGSGVIALLLQLISLIPSLIMQRIVDRYIPEGNLKKLPSGSSGLSCSRSFRRECPPFTNAGWQSSAVTSVSG